MKTYFKKKGGGEPNIYIYKLASGAIIQSVTGSGMLSWSGKHWNK